MRVVPSAAPVATFTNPNFKDAFPFRVSAELVGTGDPNAKPSDDKAMDRWRVTIKEELYGGSMVIDFRSGLGLREGWRYVEPRRRTLHDEDAMRASRPKMPDAKTVLSCIGLDLGILDECPADDGAALDYLMTEYGHSTASAALDSLRVMRKMRDDAAKMLRGTGLDLDSFVRWCSSLDA